MTDAIEALSALRQAQTGLTPAELLALPMDEYARVTGRATPIRAALQALDAERAQAPQPPAPGTAEAVADDMPQGIDVSQLTMEQYAEFRQQAGILLS